MVVGSEVLTVKDWLRNVVSENASFILFVLQVMTWPVIAMLAWEVWGK
jgi:hypothetical protein